MTRPKYLPRQSFLVIKSILSRLACHLCSVSPGCFPIPACPWALPSAYLSLKPVCLVILTARLARNDVASKGGFFGFFLFNVRYSTLLHLPPLRFHCVG
jgi:hypothetical protein